MSSRKSRAEFGNGGVELIVGEIFERALDRDLLGQQRCGEVAEFFGMLLGKPRDRCRAVRAPSRVEVAQESLRDPRARRARRGFRLGALIGPCLFHRLSSD
ncbi:MAG TPA: hypothetical protein VHM01_03735 [Alphaproteobacteria bacterium]|nr:hypothetical protein [Alphaproteobacteria bacterium]